MTTNTRPHQMMPDAQKQWPNRSSNCFPPLRGKLLTHCALLLVLGLTACAEQSTRIAPPPMANTQASRSVTSDPSNTSPRQSVGPYHAQQITGDFAGYASLEQFIDQMVQKHGFEREYLMGLFSQARRKNWTLDYLAKSDQGLKGKPAAGGWTRYRAKIPRRAPHQRRGRVCKTLSKHLATSDPTIWRAAGIHPRHPGG